MTKLTHPVQVPQLGRSEACLSARRSACPSLQKAFHFLTQDVFSLMACSAVI